MFVWARGLCETKISCSASVDPSGVTGNIHMRKIRLQQGVAHACSHDGFRHLETFDEAPGPRRAQGCALTRNVARSHGSNNLLQKGILYRHEKILLKQGRLQAQTSENYMYVSGGLSLISLA